MLTTAQLTPAELAGCRRYPASSSSPPCRPKGREAPELQPLELAVNQREPAAAFTSAVRLNMKAGIAAGLDPLQVISLVECMCRR